MKILSVTMEFKSRWTNFYQTQMVCLKQSDLDYFELEAG